MRLRERDKKQVTVYAFTGMDDDVYTWGEAIALRAAIYPGGRALDAQICGERVEDTRLMLCDGEAALDVGMGVALKDGAPEFRIISMERWGHTRAVLAPIPEGRRGTVEH